MSFIVFDFETTGVDPLLDLPIQFGIIANDWKEPITKLINQPIEIPQQATDIHGITTKQMQESGIDPKQAIEMLLGYLSKYTRIVVHNGLKFDVPMLEKQCQTFNLCAPAKNLYADTAGMYKGIKIGRIAKTSESHYDYCLSVLQTRMVGLKFNIKYITEEIGIEQNQTFHDAGGDVYYTREIYRRLVNFSNIGR